MQSKCHISPNCHVNVSDISIKSTIWFIMYFLIMCSIFVNIRVNIISTVFIPFLLSVKAKVQLNDW